MGTHPVVIGIGDHQPTALQFSAEAALARGADLRVIHCVQPRVVGDLVLPGDARQQDAANRLLNDARALIDGLETAPHTEYELASGPTVAILDRASRDASLLVVGADETDWDERVFTDKVTEQFAKHAHVPVAIVPEVSWTNHVGKGVAVALEGRNPAAGPLRFAFLDASRQRRKQLDVIHALPAGTPFDELDDIRAEMSEILTDWSEEYPDVDVTRHLVRDDRVQGYLNAARDAAIFVVGRASRPRIGGMFDNPVITEVARRIRGVSVVVPNDWQDA